MDDQVARRRCQGTLCRPETGLGGSLPSPAGYGSQSCRSSVPPRSLQPVPVESVLNACSSVPNTPWRELGRFAFGPTPYRIMALLIFDFLLSLPFRPTPVAALSSKASSQTRAEFPLH